MAVYSTKLLRYSAVNHTTWIHVRVHTSYVIVPFATGILKPLPYYAYVVCEGGDHLGRSQFAEE